jgi:uncharacterized membrane protein YidH (DUF202 family)
MIHLTAEGAGLTLAALVVIVVFILLTIATRRRTEAFRQYQRREQTPEVRRMLADVLEDVNIGAHQARSRRFW